MASNPSYDVNAGAIRTLTWHLLPFLFLLYIVAYIDRINIGFAALQMQGQLGFSDAVYGLGAGMFFAGYLFFQIPSNWALERVGARRWIAFLLLAWGLVSASMMFVRGERSFYAVRFLLGVAEAGFFPGMIFYLKNWFPSAARARAVALFMTAAPMSGVIGGPVSGALLNLNKLAGLAGWQWMFLLEGVPAIVLSGAVLMYLAETPQQARWLGDVERTWLLSTLEREQHEAAAVSSSPFSFLRIGAVWVLALIYFGMNTAVYGVSFWLPKVIRSQSGIGTFQIGLLSAVPYVFTAIGMVLVGLHSDRTGERRLHVAGCALVGAVALVAAAYAGSFIAMLFGIGVAVLAANSMYGPFWAMPTALLPRAMAATGIAFINSLGNTGGLFGPYLIGLLRTSSGAFRGGFLVIAACLAVAAVATLSLAAFTRKPIEAATTAI
jgi:MFS transporter, ACS family, tartrate transporter